MALGLQVLVRALELGASASSDQSTSASVPRPEIHSSTSIGAPVASSPTSVNMQAARSMRANESPPALVVSALAWCSSRTRKRVERKPG